MGATLAANLRVAPSFAGLLRIILAAPEACILRTQTREGTMRFCRTFGEPWGGLGVARGLWTSVILSSYAAATTVRGDSSTAISRVQYGRNVVADSRSLQSRPYWLLEKARPARPRAGEERSRQSQTRVGRSVEFWRAMSLLCLAAWFHSLLRSLINPRQSSYFGWNAVPHGTRHASRRRVCPPSR